MTAALPLFPLGTVLFPGLVLPLHIFEERYRKLMRDLMALPADEAREFGVVAIRSGWEVEHATPGGESSDGLTTSTSLSLYEVGCSAQVRQVTEHPDGRFDIVTVGRRRFRIVDVDTTAGPYLHGRVEWLDESAGEPGLADALAPGVLEVFQRYLRMLRGETSTGEQLPDDPNVLSHLVAATASLTMEDRQSLLAEPDTVSRLRAERKLLSREVALLDQIRAVPATLAELSNRSAPN
ncbi:LON peptidase substrate-binding domain-containing protein [Planosporangium mesophilum]|uniref:LON peptidase substrate-binding domain-containing protein n=1 Tax=Planosporangium mesophilum TaxID=689768 RepID=UPI001438FB1B|nr:LON peptidase substrate-binding domain-containing protein [Planosporangium mesophilum]NJC83593.1 LON peptidase substrate-binding domain-containing protein [Planosporangium mesophilum]